MKFIFLNKTINTRAQAAIELAVFGAIVIFLIGAIVRQGVSASHNQNQNYKVMRMALLKSFEGSQVRSGALGRDTSRNQASILVVEDRLSPDINKFGALSRTPLFAQGSGSFTQQLFYPVDLSDFTGGRNIPVMDVFVNGQHFALRMAAVVDYEIDQTRTERPWEWDESCGGTVSVNAEEEDQADQTVRGCRLFYSLLPHLEGNGFCVHPDACGQREFDLRMDLDRNGPDYYDPRGEVVSHMTWQWRLIPSLAENVGVNVEDGIYPSIDVDGDGHEEIVYRTSQTSSGRWVEVDREGALTHDGPVDFVFLEYSESGIIDWVTVLDYQRGDVDFSIQKEDVDDKLLHPGLKQEADIFTLTRAKGEGEYSGTYLEVKEGKLFNPESKEFVRSVNRKDQIDVVSRMFVMNPDMKDNGSFCDKDGIFTSPLNPAVEMCRVECHTQDTIAKTCFDTDDKILYVRSRIHENRGRRWITDVEPEISRGVDLGI